MNGYETYCLYTALKLHFSSNYDFFKYNGRVKSTTPEAYERRRDKYMFHKLARTVADRDMTAYLVANFIVSDQYWTKDLISQEAQDNWREWQKRNQSLYYTFTQDFRKLTIGITPDQAVATRDFGEYPILLNMYMSGEICIETMVILNKMARILARWNGHISDNVMYPKIRDKILKYTPFLQYDLERPKEIVKTILTE